MKSPTLLLLLFPAWTLLAQPGAGSASAGDPVASVQSGEWMSASTWDCGCIPGESSEVAIQDGHTVQLVEGDTAHTASLVVTNGGVLDIPAGARVELLVSLASIGDITGPGLVAFVGEEPKTCGPATLQKLACGTASVTLTDTLTITGELALESAALSTEGKLVLSGASGITAHADGDVTGSLTRRFTYKKASTFSDNVAAGLQGVTAERFLNIAGTSYLKEWLESTTAYLDYLPTDTLALGRGFRINPDPGHHQMELNGYANLNTTVSVTAEAANTTWRGWNLLANPLTGFTDLTQVQGESGASFGATYVWIDSLETWSAQCDGLGQFSNRGIVAPGTTFWFVADTADQFVFEADDLVAPPTDTDEQAQGLEGLLEVELEQATRIEQCVIQFGTGDAAYSKMEDAAFSSFFRGRNNLDLYSRSTDDVPLMVNRTVAGSQIIPIWVKALTNDSVTIRFGSLPENLCLSLEDIESGLQQPVGEEFSYRFAVGSTQEQHRFNLIVGGSMETSVVDAACGSSTDGEITVSGPSPDAMFTLADAGGNPVGTFTSDSTGGVFTGLMQGTYVLTAVSDGCTNMMHTVQIGAGESGLASFDIDATPDHIGCYDDHGGVALEIEGGLAPYTVTWSHGDTGEHIEVDGAGVLHAFITDAAGCSDSTTVEVLAAPHVQAGIEVTNPVLTLIDGEAEVHFENTSTGATGYQWNFGDGATSIAENPLHAYTAAGAYTVGLNAWNDYCSDTYQVVVTVETVSAVGDLAGYVDASMERTAQGWSVSHASEAFEVEVFDLTGRLILTSNGMPGLPAMLDVAAMPSVSLVHWRGLQSGNQGTWRVAH